MSNRAFSPRCNHCGERAVDLMDVPYSAQIDFDGQRYVVSIPVLSVPCCMLCSTVAFDDEAYRTIAAAFRAQAGLLPPEEIRARRTALGLSLQQFAERLGVAAALVE